MCDQNKCTRFLLYFYVLGLWILSPFVYLICDHSMELLDCLESRESDCFNCFDTNYWYQVGTSILLFYIVNTLSFTILLIHVLCNRYRIWKRGLSQGQLYSRMTTKGRNWSNSGE